jgi:hypothetical protein
MGLARRRFVNATSSVHRQGLLDWFLERNTTTANSSFYRTLEAVGLQETTEPHDTRQNDEESASTGQWIGPIVGFLSASLQDVLLTVQRATEVEPA